MYYILPGYLANQSISYLHRMFTTTASSWYVHVFYTRVYYLATRCLHVYYVYYVTIANNRVYYINIEV